MDICTKLQSAFYQPCHSYVNPDNTLTYDGEVALKCIKTGGLLGGGGSCRIRSANRDNYKRIKCTFAGPTGCGNIVNPDELNKIGDLGSITNLIP